MTGTELAGLKALVAAEEARHTGSASSFSDSSRADTDGVLQPKEDPMYSWISPKTYDHHGRRKVVFRDIQGRLRSVNFATEAEASTWIADNQKLLVSDGRPIEAVVKSYLASLETGELQPSSIATLGYRLITIVKDRNRIAIEAFPWSRAWAETAAKQSRASQTGIRAALRGLVAYAGIPAKALDGCTVAGKTKKGKDQLRIEEGRAFVSTALAAGDPLALAAVTMAVTGCRPGEVMALRGRDVDDGGAVLHVDGTKTEAAERVISVDPAFQPLLLGIARTKAPTALLFEYERQRSRVTKDPDKARRDALLRRVRQLCRAAGVPEVVSHSMRGLNATLRKTGGAEDSTITRALGHVSIRTTRAHYFAPGVAEAADQSRAYGRLLPAAA